MQSAIGLIETRGLVGLIEATDAMAKAANSAAFMALAKKKGFTVVAGIPYPNPSFTNAVKPHTFIAFSVQ